ncbi:MAG: hypothetical protein K2Q09_05890, partial [Phycisphaerales bacterium]|nr:hypothetical protein [Phycisphaerales bacterium]
ARAPLPPAVCRLMWWVALPLLFPIIVAYFSSVPPVRSVLTGGTVWSGLLLPALFVAPVFVMTVGLWHGLRRVRRAVRAASGRACIHCVQDLNGLGNEGCCPECGRLFDSAADQRSWARVHMYK